MHLSEPLNWLDFAHILMLSLWNEGIFKLVFKLLGPHVCYNLTC